MNSLDNFKVIKEKAYKFKEYEPGYIHVDVTYFPKIDGKKQYLYVGIDRATRLLYYKRYDAKTAENTKDFVEGLINFMPFKIFFTVLKTSI